MSDIEHLPIFVYGTLKRGEARERMWPERPVKIVEATTRGRLYDLGPHPALVAGDHRVRGELWFIRVADMPATLHALDQIECFGIDDVDLYVRQIVECTPAASDQPLRAYTYHFANPHELHESQLVTQESDGTVCWRGHSISP